MTELHPSDGHQVKRKALSTTRRLIETSDRRSIERTSDSAPFWIWSFVVFCFAAFFFCLYAILAKCSGNWPF